ncbi:MAG: GDSL-type esterase/lipase family protein [Mucilaginibacter sp.]
MKRKLWIAIIACFIAIKAFGQQTANADNDTLAYAGFYNIRGNIDRTFNCIIGKKKITIAFLGGSITYNPGWRPMLCNYLCKRFPDTKFRFIAAGIPSLGSLPDAFRLQRDVLDSGKVDLMFIEAAVNDRVNKTDSLTQVRDLEGIVRHARKSNPEMDMILMEFADPDKNADYDRGIIPAEVKNHELVAAHYNLPSINLAKEVHDKIANHEFEWTKDFKSIHPAMFGQQLYVHNIESLLEFCWKAYETNHQNADNAALPAMLDRFSFTNGVYVDVDKAKYFAGWKLTPDWVPVDKAHTRKGFVHIAVLENTKPGAEFTFNFNGNAVGIAVLSGPDAGMITYTIDDEPYRQIDLFTEWSPGLHLPWYLLLGSGLSDGNHLLHIKALSKKNQQSQGNACRIVYFLCNN